VIKVVSDLWQVDGFLWVLRFPPPITEILLKMLLNTIPPTLHFLIPKFFVLKENSQVVTKLKYRLLEKLYVILIELCYLPVLKGNNSYSNAFRTNNCFVEQTHYNLVEIIYIHIKYFH
jgi:hypothetical protein